MDFSAYFNYPNKSEEETAKTPRFLSRFTKEDWQSFLSYAQHQIVEKDEVIIDIDEREFSLFIVLNGEFNVLIPIRNSKRFQIISVIKEGGVVGELSFLDGRPRSAIVKATVPSEVLKLSRQDFEVLSAREPHIQEIFLFDLCLTLAYRLRKTSELLAISGA